MTSLFTALHFLFYSYLVVAIIVFFILLTDGYVNTIESILNDSAVKYYIDSFGGRGSMYVFVILVISLAWPITLPIPKVEK